MAAGRAHRAGTRRSPARPRGATDGWGSSRAFIRPGTSLYACRMRIGTALGKTLALLAALACAPAAHARTLRVHADEIVAAAGSFRGVDVDLAWPEGAPEGQLHLRAEHLQVP